MRKLEADYVKVKLRRSPTQDTLDIYKWHVPGLGEKFCNSPGTEFVCSPYYLF